METFGEYEDRGDYHRELSRDWSYCPVYAAKTALIRRILDDIPTDSRILDVGCGEGVFVESLRSRGHDVVGVDKNYSSGSVMRGDILSLPFGKHEFDAVLCLDVLEHLGFEDQDLALREIRRVIKPNGRLVVTIPNLAHLYSRVRFLLKGKLGRTASVDKHPGDRPISEILELLGKTGFLIEKRRGIFPTLPLLSRLMQRRPRHTLWLHSILNRVLPYPNLSFLNLIVCRPKQADQ